MRNILKLPLFRRSPGLPSFHHPRARLPPSRKRATTASQTQIRKSYMTGVRTDDGGFVHHTRRALAKARCTHATPHPVTGISDSGSAGASPSQSMDSSTLESLPCGIGVSVSHNRAR